VITPPEVRAVLDVSAMLSYAREHVHVGELLIMLADDNGVAGLPATALLDAHARLADDPVSTARLALLTTLPATAVLDLDSSQARLAAGVVSLVKGDLARAHAVWTALEHEAYLFTTEPESTPAIVVDVVVVPPGDT
jgi:hypothetical protein